MADPISVIGLADTLARNLAELRSRYKDWVSNPEKYHSLLAEFDYLIRDLDSVNTRLKNTSIDQSKIEELCHVFKRIGSLCDKSKLNLNKLENTILRDTNANTRDNPSGFAADLPQQLNSQSHQQQARPSHTEQSSRNEPNNSDKGTRKVAKPHKMFFQRTIQYLKSCTRVKRDTDVLKEVEDSLREGRNLLLQVSNFIHLQPSMTHSHQDIPQFIQYFDNPFRSETWLVDFSLSQSALSPNTESTSIPGTSSITLSNQPNNISQDAQVKQILLSFLPNSKQPTHSNSVPSICVYGQGGMGKSVTLQSICYDKQIRDAFYDGVHFLTLGQNATTQDVTRQFSICARHAGYEKLSKEVMEMKSADEAAREVSIMFKGKRVLFVVDDLWVSERSRTGFLREVKIIGGMSEGAILFSTRDESLRSEGREDVHFDFLETKGEGSRMILERCVKKRREQSRLFESLSEDAEKALDKILELCGGWKLCLAVAGGALSEDIRDCGNNVSLGLTTYVNILREDEEKLIHETTAQYHEHNLITIAESSVRRCKEWSEKRAIRRLCDGDLGMEEMFRSLCVIEKQKWMGVRELCRMWGVSERYGETVVKQMGRMNLVSRKLESREVRLTRLVDRVESFGTEKHNSCGEWVVRVHDRMVDVCVKLAEDKDDDGTKKWHRLLLNHCIPESESISLARFEIEESEHNGLMRNDAKCREWWDKKKMNSKYIMENLARHLVGCEMWDELFYLLTDVRWTIRRREEGGLVDLRDDFDRLIDVMKDEERRRDCHNEIEVVRRRESDGIQILIDIISDYWNVLRDKKHQFGFQVFGRIREPDREYRAVSQYMSSIDQNGPRPWLRPMRTGLLKYEDERQRGQLQIQGQCRKICVCPNQRYVCTWNGNFSHNQTKLIVQSIGSREREEYDLGVHSRPTCFDFCFESWHIAFGFSDGSIEIRNVKTGALVRKPLQIHKAKVTCVAFSESGSLIASGCVGGMLQVWDLRADEPYGVPLQRYGKRIVSIALSPNGDRVIFWTLGKTTGSLCILEVGSKSTRIIYRLETGSHRNGWCLRFSRDGDLVVSGLREGNAQVWDAHTGTPIGPQLTGSPGNVTSLDPDPDNVTSLAFNPKGDRLLIGYKKGTIRLWNVETASTIGQDLAGHEESVNFVGFTDGTRILSGSRDHTLRFWSMPSHTEPPRPATDAESIRKRSLKLSQDQSRALFVLDSEKVRVWDLHTNQSVEKPFDHCSFSISCVATNEDGSRVIVGGQNGSVLVWDSNTHSIIGNELIRSKPAAAVNCIALNRDGRYGVSSSTIFSVQVWDVNMNRAYGKPLLGHFDHIRCLSITNNGKHLASASEDKTIRIWNTHTSTEIGQLQYERTSLNDLKIGLNVLCSADDDRFITCSPAGVQVWNIQERREICEPLQAISDVQSAEGNLTAYETWLQEQLRYLNTSETENQRHVCMRVLHKDANRIFSMMGFSVQKSFECESNDEENCTVDDWTTTKCESDVLACNEHAVSITASNGQTYSLANTSGYVVRYALAARTVVFLSTNGELLTCKIRE